MSLYIVLSNENGHLIDDKYPSDEWWKMGQYEGECPEDAIELAFGERWGYPPRHGNKRYYFVAVVGPDIGWKEYTVTETYTKPTCLIEQGVPKRPQLESDINEGEYEE